MGHSESYVSHLYLALTKMQQKQSKKHQKPLQRPLQLLRFFWQLILAIIALALLVPVEICTFIVVVVKYRRWALNYFDDAGYDIDVHSAWRNRSLWNFLFVTKSWYRHRKGTKLSISGHLGINALNRDLTWFWWLRYWLLYLLDPRNRRKQWHCISAYHSYIEKHWFISHKIS